MGNQCVNVAPQSEINKDHKPDANDDWIRKRLKMKTCKTIIVDNNENAKTCMCGLDVAKHSGDTEKKTGGKWTTDKDTEKQRTNAYGEMEFNGFGEFRSESKYVRVSDDTNMDDMFELMTHQWGLGEPKLFISVTGSAKNYKMSSRDTKLFKQGLMRAAVSAGAWIITGGSNEGVMKHVGEAVRDYRLTSKKTLCDVVAIGIGTWGCIQNRDKLEIDKHEDGKARYEKGQDPLKTCAYLNPDYSHFILVDDGSQNQWGKEIEFRGNLQQKVSSTYMDHTGKSQTPQNEKGVPASQQTTDAVKIPVVTIVIQGGPRSMTTLLNSVDHKIPIVAIEGSGGVADMIADAYKSAGKNGGKVGSKVEKKIREELKGMITKEQDKEKRVNNHYTELQKIIEQRHLVSIHKLSSFENKGLDLTILEALVEADRQSISISKLLTLALHWNRIDFVKKRKIELNDEKWEKASPDLMMSALKLNRADFVDLYLANGFQMQTFLTKDRLKSLYVEEECRSAIQTFDEKLKKENMAKDFFNELDALLQQMIGNLYRSNLKTTKEDLPFENPCQHLFIWSVVMNRMEMAKVFWRQIEKNPIAAALVASALLNKMTDNCNDDVLCEELRRNSVEFSRLAIDVANMCYEEDENKAHQLLNLKLDEWGGVTCLELAAETENKHFISQTTCKTYLHRLWMGNLSYTTKWASLVLPICALLPLLILTSVDFNSYFQENIMTDKPEKPKKWGRISKIRGFYTSPIIKFFLHVVSYVAFLIYFSLILLVEFDSTFRRYDIVLIIWVVSIFIEEMLQFQRRHKISCCGRGSSERSGEIFQSHTVIWTIVDIAAFSFFLIGMVVRFANPERTINVARLFLGLDLMLFYFRSIHIFTASKNLGPKIVMIAQMFVDLLYFLVILMIFVLAYAIASYSILYPNSLLNGDLVMKVGRSAYWNLYGEIMVDELEMKEPECTFNPALYENGTLPRCATELGAYVVPILMGIYVMFSNILLLNLLIAMFSNTFNRIQAKADLLWHYQQYYLTKEYLSLSPIPSPVVILYHGFLLFRNIRNITSWCKKCRNVTKSDDKTTGTMRSHFDRYNKDSKDIKKKMLQSWERIMASHYVDNKATSQQEKTENETSTQPHFDTDGDVKYEQSALSRRMYSMEQKMMEISTALSRQQTQNEQTVQETEIFEANLQQTDAESDARETQILKKRKKKKDKKAKKAKKDRKLDYEVDIDEI